MKITAEGLRFRTRIVCVILENDAKFEFNLFHINSLFAVDGESADEIYTYIQVLDFIERDNLDEPSETE
jgi:hypothetical protein